MGGQGVGVFLLSFSGDSAVQTRNQNQEESRTAPPGFQGCAMRDASGSGEDCSAAQIGPLEARQHSAMFAQYPLPLPVQGARSRLRALIRRGGLPVLASPEG